MISRQYYDGVAALMGRLDSSRHDFFQALQTSDVSSVTAAAFLDAFYTRYQAAMHATRAMVYFLPHLDEIHLRKIKCKIISDDDYYRNGDSHHSQLERTFAGLIGRSPSASDEFFGEPGLLAGKVDEVTGRFVRFIHSQYPRSLGPWIAVEGLAHGWIEALANALEPSFPHIHQTPYFVENLHSEIELEHKRSALDAGSLVIRRFPNLLEETLEGVHQTGTMLNSFWDGCLDLLRSCRLPQQSTVSGT